ncbi:nucleotide pyrophosphohydrolase [Geodermatophilus sp. SYSU D00684]
MSDIEDLTRRMRAFTEARDWGRFHDPKSLALALVIEGGELAELLQWLPADDQMAAVCQPRLHDRLREETADMLLYLLRLADIVGVDLAMATRGKLAANEKRFPPDEAWSIAPVKE